jgi:hypothetical protein
MEIIRRFFVVMTLIWGIAVIFFMCLDINQAGKEQYDKCMATNAFSQYDEAFKSKCHYSAEYASVYSVVKFTLSRNDKSDEYRLIFWIPVVIWWGIFFAIKWIAGGAKGKGA